MECASPWQLVQGCSARFACTLPTSPAASSAWQVSHFTGVTAIRMRIFLDGRVAIAAVQAAMNRGMKLRPVHCNAVPRRILQTCVRMAGQAICLRGRCDWHGHKQKHRCGEGQRDGGNIFHGNFRQTFRAQARERKTAASLLAHGLCPGLLWRTAISAECACTRSHL